jgi:putative peptidoglycan lipid II flippase
VAILTYVLLLGWLQFRRFEREAKARDATLKDTPGMLGAALQMAAAACIAIGAGWGVRILLLSWLPGVHLVEIVTRATALCGVGIGIYLGCLRIFGIHELAEVERLAARRFGLWRSGNTN